jgi:hypothetical protein
LERERFGECRRGLLGPAAVDRGVAEVDEGDDEAGAVADDT